jgi:hypothetical protein
MSFKKKPPKPPKATLDDLLQSGAVKTGKQVAENKKAKEKQAAEFSQSAEDELRHQRKK